LIIITDRENGNDSTPIFDGPNDKIYKGKIGEHEHIHIFNTPSQTQGGSTTLSLKRRKQY
jgi:hypothetical protein